MGWWTRVWVTWATVGLAIETAAMAHERVPQDTLTQNLQALLGVRRPDRRLRFAGWIAFLVWLTVHLWA